MKTALRNALLATFFNLFDDDFFNPSLLSESGLPAVNVRQEEGHYQLEVIAPGLKKEDFKRALSEGTLTMSAENKIESEEKKDTYRRKNTATDPSGAVSPYPTALSRTRYRPIIPTVS